MVNFTIDAVQAIMEKPLQIRNMSVIAHVDHGKSTLTDSLISAAGIVAVAKAGDARYMDTRADEQERTITIKSTAISLYYHVGNDLVQGLDDDKRHHLINLIDSPGHVDFSSEVTAALRVTDGALVVVDCVEQVCVQTETVLRQALQERIKPVLMINKLDRAFLELQLDPDDAYNTFANIIQQVNANVATFYDEALGDVMVDPSLGTVAFGSGYFGWAFTLRMFAQMYSARYNLTVDKLLKRLWGENFYNPTTKKWTSEEMVDGKRLKRGFCQYIMDPMYQIVNAVQKEDEVMLGKILTGLKIELKAEEKDLPTKKKLKCIMQHWLPAGQALLSMIVGHLPSPAAAQKYRAELLYTGPLDDAWGTSIKACNKDGPLVLYISKMVPTADKGRFYAFGRVFSGRVKTGQKVRIMGPNYVFGGKTDISTKNIQRTVLMMGRYQEAVEDVPCGNVVGLVGVDTFIVKTATICDEDAKEAHPLKDMKYSVSPVVRVAVEPKNAQDLPKLVEGLKRLAKSDPLVMTMMDQGSGEHIIAGAGELHLEICLKDLKEDFLGGMDLRISPPVVTFRESVQGESDVCLAKSANKHNRVYSKCKSITEELAQDFDDGKIKADGDPKERSKYLVDNYEWDGGEVKKIWAFGPEVSPTNLICDQTKGVSGLQDVKDSFVSAFQETCLSGVLCDEQLRGVGFFVQDVTMHADNVHRGANQMIPTCRRNYYAGQLTADPIMMEPVFLAEIQTREDVMGGIYGVLNKRRGIILGDEQRPGTPIITIKAYLPVLESFGFTDALRAATGGQAFPQCVFDHWQAFPGCPTKEGDKVFGIVQGIRKRKGLKEAIPEPSHYMDKL
jgi:elongation factor 2